MEIVILIAQILLKYGPSTAREFQLLFAKKEITQADWEKVFALAEEPWKPMEAQE